MQRAIDDHRAGRFESAARGYQSVLDRNPSDVDALHYLGLAIHHQGRHSEALPLMENARKLRPHDVNFHANLGPVYRALGRHVDASICYEAAIALSPSTAALHHNLGNVLFDQRSFERAEQSYRRACEIDPQYAEAWMNLGKLYDAQNKLTEAEQYLQTALSLKPGLTPATFTMGKVKGKQGKFAEAEAFLRRGLNEFGRDAEAWHSLGIVLAKTGRAGEARDAYHRALAIRPDYADAFCNLGSVLAGLAILKGSEECLLKAIALNPTLYEAHLELARTYSKMGRLHDAMNASDEADRLRPDAGDSTLIAAAALVDAGRTSEAIEWYERGAAKVRKNGRHFDVPLLAYQYSSDFDPTSVAEQHFRSGRKLEDGIDMPAHGNTPEANRPLRIGYVSGDFRLHSVMYFFEPLLRHHDRAQFKLHAFSENFCDDEYTGRLRPLFAKWHTIRSKPDVDVCAMIRDAGIDVLIDLAGHTSDNRLSVFARKPAPVQMTFLGYPNTTGLRRIDYRITDSIADPTSYADSLHSETLLRLDRCAWCYQPPSFAPKSTDALSRTGVVFGSFNNFAKLSTATQRLWAKILTAVPDSRLLLKSKCFNDPVTVERVETEFARLGIAAGRLQLLPPIINETEHLAAYSQIDIALDPFPYNGTTTTCEALWMGVPVITMPGQVHASRVGASLLRAAGFDQWIAENESEYVTIASRLAAAPAERADLRRTLRDRLSAGPLLDGTAYASSIERAIRSAWRNWCATR